MVKFRNVNAGADFDNHRSGLAADFWCFACNTSDRVTRQVTKVAQRFNNKKRRYEKHE